MSYDAGQACVRLPGVCLLGRQKLLVVIIGDPPGRVRDFALLSAASHCSRVYAD
jgi:hypothetical protein